MIADVLSQDVLSFSATSGDFLGGLKETATAQTDPHHLLKRPSFLHQTPRGLYFLEDEEDDVIVQLNNDMNEEFRTRVDGSMVVETRPVRLNGIYGWQPMNEGFIAFADVEFEDVRGPGRFKSVFLHFDERGIQRMLDAPMDSFDEVRNHYLRTMPYIATLDGERGFLLYMEEFPSIREVRVGASGIRELSHFPEDFRSVPRLVRHPKWARTLQGARQATAFYEKLEASTMAAGLYAWDGQLYLAAKQAITEQGETAWWLIGLDPQDGRELSRARLPTTAAHLTIVTGNTFALIEKGPVEGIGRQHSPYMETASAVLIPATWLWDHDSPLRVGAAAVECLRY